MRTFLIAIAVCAAPAAFAQNPVFPITPAQDMNSITGLYGSAGSPDCTSDRQQVAPERAIEVCTQIIDSNAQREHRARAFVMRGDRREDLGQADLATADFESALALYSEQVAEAPLTPQGHVGRAWVQLRLNRLEEGLADAVRAAEVNDGHGSAFFIRAQAYFLLGRYQESAADYDRAAQIARRMATRGSGRALPSSDSGYVSPRVLAGRCEARAAAGFELGIAETACRAAMRNSSTAVFSRGFLRFKQGRYEEAWADFNAAHEADPTSGYSLYGRGVSAVRLGRTAEGQADIARGREIEGEDLDGYARAGLAP